MGGQHHHYSEESTPEASLFKTVGKKCGISSNGMVHFYRAALESILINAITVWFGDLSVRDRDLLDKVCVVHPELLEVIYHTYQISYKSRLQKKTLLTQQTTFLIFFHLLKD